MNKHLIVIGIAVLLICVGLSGCTQQDGSGTNGNGNTTGKTVTMTVKELYDDIVPTSMIGGMVFNSLDDGDILIINDKIPENITFDTDRNATVMIYSWSEGNYYINIQGDITDNFQPMDDYKLTVHIKYVELNWDNQIVDLECFNEQWVSQEYFFNNFATGGLKPLPQNCIEKA